MIEAWDARFEIPLVPTVADSAAQTPNGPIGVAISGAVFFNPDEGDGSAPEFGDDTYPYHVSSQANYISECFTGVA